MAQSGPTRFQRAAKIDRGPNIRRENEKTRPQRQTRQRPHEKAPPERHERIRFLGQLQFELQRCDIRRENRPPITATAPASPPPPPTPATPTQKRRDPDQFRFEFQLPRRQERSGAGAATAKETGQEKRLEEPSKSAGRGGDVVQ